VEKTMKKLHVIIIIIIVIIILVSTLNWIKNDDEKNDTINYADPYEVEIILEFDKEQYFYNETSITGNLTIKNVINEDIYIYKYFIYGHDVGFLIQYNEFNYGTGQKHYDDESYPQIKISPMKSISYHFNLYDYNFYPRNGKQIRWLNNGTYDIYAIYHHDFISNTVQISIE
jgi:hypothetical protein